MTTSKVGQKARLRESVWGKIVQHNVYHKLGVLEQKVAVHKIVTGWSRAARLDQSECMRTACCANVHSNLLGT